MSPEYVACMEDVLDLYAEPHDPTQPVVCVDETSKQLVKEVQDPIPAAPGQVRRYDYEYERNGTRNLFLFCEPLAGWRHVAVTERRTCQDFAEQLRWLVDEVYPDAEKVRVVADNLNTHRVASLYQAFAPEEARRIAKRLEFHHTPKHGSWLNMVEDPRSIGAEIELGVFIKQCLRKRIGDEAALKREAGALERERNGARATVTWRFTTQDARTRLAHLYPVISTQSHH